MNYAVTNYLKMTVIDTSQVFERLRLIGNLQTMVSVSISLRDKQKFEMYSEVQNCEKLRKYVREQHMETPERHRDQTGKFLNTTLKS